MPKHCTGGTLLLLQELPGMCACMNSIGQSCAALDDVVTDESEPGLKRFSLFVGSAAVSFKWIRMNEGIQSLQWAEGSGQKVDTGSPLMTLNVWLDFQDQVKSIIDKPQIKHLPQRALPSVQHVSPSILRPLIQMTPVKTAHKHSCLGYFLMQGGFQCGCLLHLLLPLQLNTLLQCGVFTFCMLVWDLHERTLSDVTGKLVEEFLENVGGSKSPLMGAQRWQTRLSKGTLHVALRLPDSLLNNRARLLSQQYSRIRK